MCIRAYVSPPPAFIYHRCQDWPFISVYSATNKRRYHYVGRYMREFARNSAFSPLVTRSFSPRGAPFARADGSSEVITIASRTKIDFQDSHGRYFLLYTRRARAVEIQRRISFRSHFHFHRSRSFNPNKNLYSYNVSTT